MLLPKPFYQNDYVFNSLWVLGPTSILLYKFGGIPYYLAGSALFFLLLILAIKANKWLARTVFILLSISIWILFGLIVYAPSI